jgi:two-component system, response regulator
MESVHRNMVILLADDDPDDRLLVWEAVREGGVPGELHAVNDGEELLDYLHRRGKFASTRAHPLPDLILLDLNMPRKDGRATLAEIKQDPDLRWIPVVAFTTSSACDDVRRAYDLGVCSYITKPQSFDGLVELMRTLGLYWGKCVVLPGREEKSKHGGPPS